MAAQLYNEGDTHEIRGIKCTLQNFPINQLDARLKEGWVKTPEDIGRAEKESKVKKVKKVEEKEENPVRLKAKEAGIEGWDTKRIKTLEAALDDDKD